MRTIIGAMGGIVFLVVGFFSLQSLATSTQEQALNASNQSAEAYNVSTDVFGGIGQAAGPGIVWFGIAAVILVALGFLVYSGSSGR